MNEIVMFPDIVRFCECGNKMEMSCRMNGKRLNGKYKALVCKTGTCNKVIGVCLSKEAYEKQSKMKKEPNENAE